MGKRIYRISFQEALIQQSRLLFKELNIVLKNGTVFPGRVHSIGNDKIVCFNSRQKLFEFRENDIKEIIYDVVSNY